ncbi:MAG: T9SS type A sorting domain-containing protein [Bacteroidales bacterium]
MRKFLLLVVTFFTVSGLFAQWVPQNTNFTTGSRGINYMQAVTADIVWAVAYDGSGTGAYISEFSKTTDGGNVWTPGQILTTQGYGIGNLSAIDATTAWAAVYYNGNQNNTCGVYKTVDGGVTWTQQTVLQGAASFANNVYFWDENNGMCHGDLKDGYFEVYTTTDGGTTWTRVPQANFTGAALASGEAGWTGVIEVAGNSVMYGSNKGKLWKSDDKGLNWVASVTGASAAGTNGGINDIAFKDSQDGLVGHANETTYMYDLYETHDGGTTWAPVAYTGTAFNNDLTYVPGTPNTYVCTGANTNLSGCAYSFNGGHTWTDFNATQGTQFLSTDWYDNAHGWAGDFNDATTPSMGGMYKYNDVLTDILSIDPAKGGFSIYPNPSNGVFTIAVIGVENQNVTINVYDMIGKLVYQDNASQSLISYNMTLDLQNLPKGVYIAEVTSAKTKLQQRIVIE